MILSPLPFEDGEVERVNKGRAGNVLHQLETMLGEVAAYLAQGRGELGHLAPKQLFLHPPLDGRRRPRAEIGEEDMPARDAAQLRHDPGADFLVWEVVKQAEGNDGIEALVGELQAFNIAVAQC